MTNLEYLFANDGGFHEAVSKAAADAIGSTNPEFAAEWLEMQADKPVGALGRYSMVDAEGEVVS